MRIRKGENKRNYMKFLYFRNAVVNMQICINDKFLIRKRKKKESEKH